MSADVDEIVWTQGTSLAAKNAARLAEINSASTPPCESGREPRCGLCWIGESWDPKQRWRSGFRDGPNARTETT